ncbi:MAG: ABC transporter permease [Clostridiales bacterium]|jgi:ribose transport system permease protein|nr:ABC transporter permease [Clostridiales bacterium]
MKQLKAFVSRNKGQIVRYGSLFIVVLAFSLITKGAIFSEYNLKSLCGQACALLIASVGMIFIFSHGAIDIASGSVAGLSSLAVTLALNQTGSMAVAVIVSCAVSVLLYLFCWFATTKFGLMSTIASLAVMFVARGIVTYILSAHDGRINIADYSLISPWKNSVALQLALMATFSAACVFLFNYTALGKRSKAIGDNPVSAEQSGAKLAQVKLWCYVAAGLCVGAAGVFVLARAGNVSKNIGAGMEMSVMIAVILGGMNLSGGTKSRVSAAIVGTITYTLLSNGLSIAGMSQQRISLAKGIIFLIIIAATLRQDKQSSVMPR